jgi:predicted XRE-type DNA-binding protein
MLDFNPNTEAAFDATLKRAVPFLIFAPAEYRNNLAAQMESLWHFYQSRDSGSELTFIQRNKHINDMLDHGFDACDPTSTQQISSFDNMQMSYHTRLTKIERDLADLQKGGKVPVKKKETVYAPVYAPVETIKYAEPPKPVSSPVATEKKKPENTDEIRAVADALKYALQQNNMSQVRFSKLCGCAESSISAYLRGERKCPDFVLAAAKKYLDFKMPEMPK